MAGNRLGSNTRPAELWNSLVLAGLLGFAAVMVGQLALILSLPRSGPPVLPSAPNQLLLSGALWLFCFPVAWGFSARLLGTFLGLGPPRRGAAFGGLGLLLLGRALEIWSMNAGAKVATAAAVLLATYSLRVLEPSVRPAKVLGVHRSFPFFGRLPFAWLVIAALLPLTGNSPGLLGASRHAFTVGFLGTLIFAIGPRILPSFLNSRELWSPRLMGWALGLLGAGCLVRVISEPLAYANLYPLFWRVLPVSAAIELTAVLVFAYNIVRTLATPMPAWFYREQVKDIMPLYWYVTSYPATRRLLIDSGLHTLRTARQVPTSLTLREAADAEGIESHALVEKLAAFFEARLARTLRKH